MTARFSLFLATALLLAAPLRADETTRQVQEELRKRDLYFGDIDGRSTPGLSAALLSYQQRKGFAATGQLTEETLRSLSLLPPAPQPPELPDVPVLKSDAAPVLASAPTAAPPTFAPPPAAARKTQITPDEARLFVERYLLAGQANNPAAEVALYADQVDYFDDGQVDRAFIERDIRRYDRRWPERYFSLSGPVRLVPTDEPSRTIVEITYRFLAKGRKYRVQGRIETTYTLAGDRPEDLRIVSIKERRLHR